MNFSIKEHYENKLFERFKIIIYLNNGETHEINDIEQILYEDEDVIEYLIPQGNLSTDVLIFKNHIFKIVRDN